jgi:hypothetical protein
MVQAIRQKVAEGRFEFTQHAVDQSIVRRISAEELRQAITTGEIIEDYPVDRYGPSCLILGYTDTGRALHIHCSYATRNLIKIITVYQPDPSQWIDFRTRRPMGGL